MAIPDFQTVMLPLLKQVADKAPWKVRDATSKLADHFGLTDEERNALLPSGSSLIFPNRVAWARTYMAKAALLSSPGRGLVQITDQGLALLAENPSAISIDSLMRYPEFVAFRQGAKHDNKSIDMSQPLLAVCNQQDAAPPQEQLEQAYNTLLVTLIDDLVVTLKGTTPARFEQIVVDVLTAMGYGGNRQEAGRTVGKTGDGGIDGIINEDRLGLDAVYIQAKRWANDVGAGEIRDFKGALDGHGAAKGVFITTAGFTKAALDEVSRSRNYKIVLIDGAKLARFMIEYNVGVSTAATYELKKIDSDYFSEE